MTATLPATHLLRQFLLFALIVVFLLLMVRAGYALWQFPAVEEAGTPVRLFLTGLRFDLSLVAGVCLAPLVLGSLLGMFDATRGRRQGTRRRGARARPDRHPRRRARPRRTSSAPTGCDRMRRRSPIRPVSPRRSPRWRRRTRLPSALGALLLVLIVVAYVARMETGRFLRFRLSRPVGDRARVARRGGLRAARALDARSAGARVVDGRCGCRRAADRGRDRGQQRLDDAAPSARAAVRTRCPDGHLTAT